MMKKFSYILFFVFCSLPLCAQHGPKTALAAREALAKTLPQTAAKQASASLLKALPAHASRLTAQTALPGYRISVPAEPEHAALYQRLERRLRQAVVLSPADRIYNEHTREALIKPFPVPQPPYQLEDWERFSQQEVAAYFALYRDMREFHTYLVQKMVPLLSYFRPGKLAPEEKQLLADQISSFRQRIDQHLSKMVSLDAALARMLTDMNLAMEVMFDMKGQLVPHRIQRQKPFDENTFRLLPPEQAAPRLAVRDEKTSLVRPKLSAPPKRFAPSCRPICILPFSTTTPPTPASTNAGSRRALFPTGFLLRISLPSINFWQASNPATPLT